MSERIDLAAARALVSGYAPEEAVSVKAGSVLALIDAVEAARTVFEWRDFDPVGDAGRKKHEEDFNALEDALDRFTFGGDATA